MKKIWYVYFAGEGYPCSDFDVCVDEVDNINSTVFKPGFNYFTRKKDAVRAQWLIQNALRFEKKQ